MRIWCKLTGCGTGPDYPACARCGADIYDFDFIPTNESWLGPWYEVKWWFQKNRWRFGHKCENESCDRLMLFTPEHCCSDYCYERWMPF